MANKLTGCEKSGQAKDKLHRSIVTIDAELILALTPLEFITYAQIKKLADEHNECEESILRMSAETSISSGSIKRSIKSLLAKNLIAKEKRSGATNIYKVTPPTSWKLQAKIDN